MIGKCGDILTGKVCSHTRPRPSLGTRHKSGPIRIQTGVRYRGPHWRYAALIGIVDISETVPNEVLAVERERWASVIRKSDHGWPIFDQTEAIGFMRAYSGMSEDECRELLLEEGDAELGKFRVRGGASKELIASLPKIAFSPDPRFRRNRRARPYAERL